MATELAQAYVQIIPSAEGIKEKLRQELGGGVDDAGKSAGSGWASAFSKAAGAAVAAGAAAVGALTKAAVENYGEYEQLVGGVETLFGAGGKSIEEYAASVGKTVSEVSGEYNKLIASQQAVMDNASTAYKTAGLSANEYMETVTSFSASLLQSLGGDTEKAASVADQAITDMSDNANKMGTDMEMIQNAYQGFAKQNYTMLDNLKLGYGGTKEEMERLLENASALSGVEYDISSYADIVEAIHVVQTEMGITGTTAKEASSTIQGSLAMAKSAWENLLTGLADKDADLGSLIGNLTESVGTAAENLMPVITQTLGSIGLMVQELAPVISEQLPALAQELLPALLSAGSALLTGVLNGILQALPSLIGPAVQLVLQLGTFIVQNLPLLIEAASQIILQLATGIGENLPALLPAIVDVVLQIVDTLIDNVGLLVDAAVEIIVALAEGILDALPKLIEKAPEIISKLVTALIQNVPLLLNAGAQAIGSLVGGIIQNLPQIATSARQIISTLWNALSGLPGQALQWGADMLQSFINGIASKVQGLWDSIQNIAQGVRDFLGFSEPKEGPLSDFHTYAPDMMALYAQGITRNRKKLTDALESVAGDMALPFSGVPAPAAPGAGTAAGGAVSRGTSIGTVTFNIQAREDQDLDRLAEEIMLRLYELVEGKRRQFA